MVNIRVLFIQRIEDAVFNIRISYMFEKSLLYYYQLSC